MKRNARDDDKRENDWKEHSILRSKTSLLPPREILAEATKQ